MENFEKIYKIDRKLAAKVLKVVDAGLVQGMGDPIPGQMCVEAAVCYAMNLHHSDEPPCVNKGVRQLKIELNDLGHWPSDEARANGMRRLAIAQLGSNSTIATRDFLQHLLYLAATKYVPMLLEYDITRYGENSNPVVNAAIRKVADLCRKNGNIDATKKLISWDDYRLSGYAKERLSRFESILSNPFDADESKYNTLVVEVFWFIITILEHIHEDGDENMLHQSLKIFSEEVVQILIKLKSPGTNFLYLTETN